MNDRTPDAQTSWRNAIEAVRADHPEQLQQLLTTAPQVVSQRDPSSGYSLLHYIPQRPDEPRPNRVRCLRLLIAAGLEVDAALPGGETALHFAGTLDDMEVTDALIELGASVRRCGSGDGGTPLVQALFYGCVTASERLAQVEMTPVNLRTAAGMGRNDLVRSMVVDGQPTAQARAHRAFYRPHDEFPAWTPSDDPAEIMNEALIYAAHNGRLDTVLLLLDQGADINGMPYFCTALHFAAYDGRREMVELLLEHGADRQLPDRMYSGTASGWAEHGGHPRLAQLLKV